MKKFFKTAALLLLLSIYVFPQSDTLKTTLSDVVVSATKTQTPYYTLASSVSVITSEMISKRQLGTVVDVLREIPGISVSQQGGPGKLSKVFIRGANSNHTLVLLDGIVMNDASSTDNAFDFSTLNTNDIERIEVVRGPQSTLYGADAVAGVVNIITKHGVGRPKYSIEAESGSNKYYKGNLSALGTYGDLGYSFQATRYQSDGISAADSKYGNTEKDGYSNTGFTSNIDYSIEQNARLNLFYKYTKAKADLDQLDETFTLFTDDPNYTYNLEEQLFKGGADISLFEGTWKQQLNASYIKRNSHYLDLPDQIRMNTSSEGFYNSERIKFDWQNNLQLNRANLMTVGIETANEIASTEYNSSSFGTNTFPEESIRTTSFYLQDQVNFFNSLFASVGLRYDNNEKYGGITTFRIAPAYYIASTGTKIKATYGTGFKAPSLYFLFEPVYGNPNLKPEKSRGFDFGFDQFMQNEELQFGITYFNLQLRDMFGYDANFKEINIAKASSQGAEFYAKYSLNNGLSINANYTYNQTKDEYSGSEDYNQPLIRRPKNQASVNLNYEPIQELNINAEIKYTNGIYDKDFSVYPAQRVKLPDYTLINISASYKLLEYLMLTGRIENLTNKKYEEVLYYGTLGRSFYAGFNFTL